MQEEGYDGRPRSFQVYAPARTAVVYALTDGEVAPELKPRGELVWRHVQLIAQLDMWETQDGQIAP